MAEQLGTATLAAVKPAIGTSIAPINGARKQWKPAKAAFRPKAGTSKPWEVRLGERKAMAAMKAREKELKDEKETAKRARITALKEKREKQVEKERYAKLAEKMHVKRVERLKRREKRNKALKER
ncbi:rRNA-processing protein cgr1 [Maublancomyces gigas]|uniref:rRNA-processing protein n=1 Tax=Discina gigas TaxID=1032678 RepID=A0ABR3GWW2_9PEZI